MSRGLTAGNGMARPVVIDAAFPGGNIVVERVDGDEAWVRQDLRDTDMDWFYWCFRVRGAAGRLLRVHFTGSGAFGTRGPAVSFDEGRAWSWLGREAVEGKSFRCAIPTDASEVRFSFAMPYQESRWLQFMHAAEACPSVQQGILCVTPRGRPVERAILCAEEHPPAYRVVVACRHHCCEMMANYALEGLVDWTLRDAKAAWLRRHVECFVIPFADKDGVEDGDQGKGRRPRDHGRDYEGECLYAETRAIRAQIPEWGDGRLRVGLDLHCPYLGGKGNEEIYLVGSPHERVAREQLRFAGILESVADGPLPFSSADFVPFGTRWNTRENYASGKGFAQWVSELPGVTLGTAFEIPYATANGAEVNQASARRFGADLGKALSAYLRGNDADVGHAWGATRPQGPDKRFR